MATSFALNHFGATFQVKLVDCVSNANIDQNDFEDQFIIFYKPDGTRFEKTAQLVEFPPSTGNFFVTYTNSDLVDTESILDLIGKWEYSAKVTINSNTDEFETSERFVFWVK